MRGIAGGGGGAPDVSNEADRGEGGGSCKLLGLEAVFIDSVDDVLPRKDWEWATIASDASDAAALWWTSIDC